MLAKRSLKLFVAFLFTLVAFSNTSLRADLDGDIKAYQRSLIDQETTGSNVVIIFKDGKRIYHQAVQSGKAGDKEIDENTIFPIWSMSKPIPLMSWLAVMVRHWGPREGVQQMHLVSSWDDHAK